MAASPLFEDLTKHQYASVVSDLDGEKYFSLPKLNDSRVEHLPYSIRVLLESAVRNCDEFEIKKADVENILNWKQNSGKVEVPFKPARVVLQDFTGVPAVVDLAAMRDAMARFGGDASVINPLVPVDLVIDHSVQVDYSRRPDALELNQEIEFERNKERFAFLKWGAKAFENMTIVPPGSGIVHQVNLEYLAKVVFGNKQGILYPDSLVGTDSHTTMIDGLGIAGWGVGGIEAEAVMLGQAISMVLPEVIGFRLTGELNKMCTATDLVLTCVNMLRKLGVVGKFVEFYGPGCANLTVADRSTIANMAPEYGATMGYFPADSKTLDYLRQTGRTEEQIKKCEAYLRKQNLFRTYAKGEVEPTFNDVLNLDLSTVVPSVAGPKRPHDRVSVSDLKKDFLQNLTNKVGFKGFGLPESDLSKKSKFMYKGTEYELSQGSVVLCAITSCTNTSNPGVMIGAGLLCKNAIEAGLTVKPYIKTSLSPGSGVVDNYLKNSNLLTALETLGFYKTGYGCQTCIGNSGELDDEVSAAIVEKDLVVGAVLSGNRNFEGRVHPLTRANYLASPPLVVAYALAGRVDIDFETEPLATVNGKEVFLRDIWPNPDEVRAIEKENVKPSDFIETYKKVEAGPKNWNALEVVPSKQYNWDDKSTYIHNPPFFQGMGRDAKALKPVKDAYCLLNFGDSITTDHISPAGKITKNSPGGRYLMERGIQPKDFNSYGSRRGNDEIMARGTFANIRIVNKLNNSKVGPQTLHIPSNTVLDIFDAATKYVNEDKADLIVLAGKEYGSGSSRDWAAKGPFLQGIKVVIAESFERIHRSNLVGMGILPLQFLNNENADSLGLTGKERFSVDLSSKDLTGKPKVEVEIVVYDPETKTNKNFKALSRLDTEPELAYFKNGGILSYVMRRLARENNIQNSKI